MCIRGVQTRCYEVSEWAPSYKEGLGERRDHGDGGRDRRQSMHVVGRRSPEIVHT